MFFGVQTIWQAKAWIDMFGYRTFRMFGSLLIHLCTRWLPTTMALPQLSWLTPAICALWIAVVLAPRYDYSLMAQRSS